ncbi:unnamed protein product [Strongylus vulgaris]|uniref:Aminopeptidase N-like N-terminal domain-containing protein n=1 Tax=Strongylus vulgaris TaxID=40348 RepID=A0A3P7KYC2_STRVU|nr:unnamed protein product [Strongylus vulgaris]
MSKSSFSIISNQNYRYDIFKWLWPKRVFVLIGTANPIKGDHTHFAAVKQEYIFDGDEESRNVGPLIKLRTGKEECTKLHLLSQHQPLESTACSVFKQIVNFHPKNHYLKIAAVTQFEPADARKMVPCFDEPEFKAVWNVTLIHPAETRAIANTIEMDVTL